MQVLEVGSSVAICADDRGERHEVAVDLVEPVDAGARLLVHAGVAIGQL